MRARWGAPLLAGTALLVGLTAAGSTFAIWTAGTGPDAVTISAGDLDIEPAGAAVWQETSADVSGTPRTIDPETFLVRQGDTVDVTYQVTSHLQGENMLGQLEVDWTDPADLPTGVAGTYTVFDAGGDALTPQDVPLGTATTFPDRQLRAGDAGRTDHFTLTISLDFTDLEDRGGAGSAPQLTDLGAFDVELHQVRTGVGSS